MRDLRNVMFEDLYERYRSAVWLYCRRRVGADRADDVMGEVFLTVWRRIDEAPPAVEALPWLYRICYLTVYNHWRGAARRWRLESKLSSIRVTPPLPMVDLVVLREEVAAVVRLLDRLHSSDAEILRLTAWEGLSSTEITEVLDLSPDAVRQKLSRARKRLAGLYQDEYDKDEHRRRKPAAQKGGSW